MRNYILNMIEIFANEGHSGYSAAYAADTIYKLMKFEPLCPLTGEDSEWNKICDSGPNGPEYQNNRCSRVFKNDKGAYDINGKVFWEWAESKDEDGENKIYRKFKIYFTNLESRVAVTFPYSPKSEYVEKQK